MKVSLIIVLILAGTSVFADGIKNSKEKAVDAMSYLQEDFAKIDATLKAKNQSGTCYLLGKLLVKMGGYDELASQLMLSRHPEIDTTKDYNYTLTLKDEGLLMGLFTNMDFSAFCNAPNEGGFGSGVIPKDFDGITKTVDLLKASAERAGKNLTQF
jgi:hypothetical protein